MAQMTKIELEAKAYEIIVEINRLQNILQQLQQAIAQAVADEVKTSN